MGDENGWSEYKKLIMAEQRRFADQIDDMESVLESIQVQLAKIETRQNMAFLAIGAMSSLVGAVLGAAVTWLMGLPPN